MLHSVIESLLDGVLIVSPQGQVLHANTCALNICHQLTREFTENDKAILPAAVWRICELLVQSSEDFPKHTVVLEDEIATDHPVPVRVRVRWLDPGLTASDCILVTLEDRYQSACRRAIAESYQYHLTEREREVWLLRRTNHSYEAIAEKLYIAVNTVKKHLKSIYAKRQDALNRQAA
jgi:DNA-binding CsgD family transcriptional regulator